MAVSVISQPSSPCFSSQCGDVVFGGVAAGAGSLEVAVLWSGGGATLLSETVWADGAGRVTVKDFTELLQPYAREHAPLEVTCTLTDHEELSAVAQFDVYYYALGRHRAFSSFTGSHFLTELGDAKITAAGRKELLNAYVDSASVSYTVQAVVMRDGSAVADSSGDTAACTLLTGGVYLCSIDASPSAMAELLDVDEGEILWYRVSVGGIRQEYRVGDAGTAPGTVAGLSFINSFGMRETFYFEGEVKTSSAFERKSVRIGGMLRNYLVREDIKFVASTGMLTDSMASVADDLLRSDSVHILESDGTDGPEVVITESKNEKTNADDGLVAYEVSYVYAERFNHN